MFRVNLSLIQGLLCGLIFYETPEYEKAFRDDWYDEIMVALFIVAIRFQWR